MTKSLCLLAVCFTITALSAADDAPATKNKPSSQAELEKQFSERMKNSVMIGSFTVQGKENQTPKEERYEIESVTKASDNYWTFLARIKYGKTDVKLPITVQVLWAGDTPMVSVTDFSIIGMKGKFTSRVLFHKDRYAGTWQHDNVGGHMFGRIEKAKSE